MAWKELHDHIEVGIIHRTLYPEAKTDEHILLETIDLMTHDLFFDRIELPHIKDPAIRKELKNRLYTTRMKVTYAASQTIFELNLDINSPNAAERKRAVNELKVCMEDAADFGADNMTMISGPMVENRGELEGAKEALVESIVELSAFAEKAGIKLQLELHDYDVDKKRLLGPTKDAVNLLERLQGRCPAFSFLIDLSHFPLLGETIDEAVFPLQHHIGYVHIGNCVVDKGDPRYGDKHPYFGYPAGSNNAKEIVQFFKALADIGYLAPGKKAAVTIETTRWEGERPEDLLVNAKRTLREAWAEFACEQNQVGGRIGG